ncbi:hypothetical protein ABKP95_02770 [Bifidobacterium longum subsp. longum]|uniref:hypothetical protein n=1 Tax=Bifidobacterium longum TaxID=216816 RepID=UPI0032DE665D
MLKKLELAQLLQQRIAPDDDISYMTNNLGMAVDVAHHDGTLLDMDTMVELARALRFQVSYELYSYLNGRYKSDLMGLCEDYKEARKILGPMIMDYLNGVK